MNQLVSLWSNMVAVTNVVEEVIEGPGYFLNRRLQCVPLVQS